MSESGDDISAMNDLLSQKNSALAGGEMIYSPQTGSPGAPHAWDGEGEYLGDRQQQFHGAVLSELAAQKSRYSKKVNGLEKQVESLRAEKSQLAQVLET